MFSHISHSQQGLVTKVQSSTLTPVLPLCRVSAFILHGATLRGTTRWKRKTERAPKSRRRLPLQSSQVAGQGSREKERAWARAADRHGDRGDVGAREAHPHLPRPPLQPVRRRLHLLRGGRRRQRRSRWRHTAALLHRQLRRLPLLRGLTLHNAVEIEDEDEGSIFYANSTSLAVQVDDMKTVGLRAFTRIAPWCPIIADLVTVHNLFDALTCSSGGRLHYFIYDKYLKSLDRVFKSVKGIMQSPLASSFHLNAGECILAVEGDRPIHPVLQHIGISAWPGTLILTTHALYFQSIRVGYGDKIVKYDLSTDSNQVIKRDFTGPLGVRLFDKAMMYKSSTLTEPIYFDFPELGEPSRRNYWLAITREVMQVNKFIRKFNLEDIQKAEALSKAILGILRYSAVKEAFHIAPSHVKTTLTFSLAEKLPKGDMVLEALYNNYFQLLDTPLSHLATAAVNRTSKTHTVPFALYALSRMGFILLNRKDETEKEISFCAACVGVTKSLEAALEESFCYSERIEAARATVDQVKVEGLDANLALMQELLFPFIQVGKLIHSLTKWEDPVKSFLFLAFVLYVIKSGLINYTVPSVFVLSATVMLWQKYSGEGKLLEVLEVRAPPSKNPVEQILTLQEAISKLEETLQAINIVLLKFRAILFAAVPKTTQTVAVASLAAAALVILTPPRHLLLMVVLEVYTREMPLRKQNTEKFRRRIREWWARIPAAPVQMVRPNENKKKI
nr:uncharacterized protein LOC127306966 isoform X1 [Lolium perenne]